MHRLLIVVGIVWLAASPCQLLAQEKKPDQIPFGEIEEPVQPLEWHKRGITIKAGATFADPRGQLTFAELGTHGFNGGFGFAIGASLELPLTPRFSVQPEVLLVRKFAEIDLGAVANGLKTKLGVNYMEVPVLLKWYPSGHGGVNTSFLLGAVPAFKVDATREIRLEGKVREVPVEGINGFDVAVVGGIGFEFHELFSALTLDLRYSHGLRKIADTELSDARWNVFYMLLGVKF